MSSAAMEVESGAHTPSTSTRSPLPEASSSTLTAKASTTKETTASPPLPRHLIRENDSLLIRLPSGTIKSVKVSINQSISLGKFGSFKAKELIGKPYGPSYEIDEATKTLKMSAIKFLDEIEETEANNQDILSQGAQQLTDAMIKEMKSEGVSARDIIQKQIDQHSGFDKKTGYSKDKYMKRKEAKYLPIFTPIEPTVHNICLYNFEKLSAKIRELRPDSLSLIMQSANVRPGGRLLVVEDVHGLVVAACLERMGGEGKLMLINPTDSPPDLHLLESFNFPPSHSTPISSLSWSATEPSWTPPDLPTEITKEMMDKVKNSRDIAKIRKRRHAYDKAKEERDDFFRGEYDAVILATEYEPYSVLERLLPYIAGSAPIVIYSPFLPILFDASLKIRSNPEFLSPTLSEPWLRKYQVLPGRTHPEMQGMAHGGYLLNTIRVFKNDEANSHKLRVPKRGEGGTSKRRKVVEEEGERNGETEA